MAQVHPTTPDFTVEELNRIESEIKELWQIPGWRRFITMITNKRNNDFNTSCTQLLDQRIDDRLKGGISALNFILNIDEKIRQLNDPKWIQFEEKLRSEKNVPRDF